MATVSPPTLTAQDVAHYFLACVDPDVGDNLSNLRLQKLLYYAQGLYLALHEGRPLFDDEVRAWQFGPAVPGVFHEYKQHGAGAIPAPDSFDPAKYSEEIRDLLDEVAAVYGQFSASRLMEMTHSEPPWKLTGLDGVISHELMRDYFKTQLIDGQE